MSVRQTTAQLLYRLTKPAMLRALAEVNNLQWRSPDEQQAVQHRHMERVLTYAHQYVPYYQKLFQKIGFHPQDYASNPACLHDLPLLTKDLVRQNFDDLITTEPARRTQLTRQKTGGTTGEPMYLMQDHIYNSYRAAHIFQQMQWSGWELGQPQGWLWGHVLAGATSETESLAARLRAKLVKRYRSNAFHLTPESMEQFARFLERHPNAVAWSYVSTMYRFAQFVRERGRPIPLHAVYTAAEPLYDHQRAYIEQTFQCRVFNSYSSVEMGHIACECQEHNGLHILMRNCHLEVLRDGQPVPDGEEGEFVLTNLTNLSFPLIRYKIEDWGKKRVDPCACGRGLPMLDVVEGRIIDFFHTADRGRVWGAFIVPMVPALGNIKQYQIVQTALDHIELRLVPFNPTDPIDPAKLADIQQACHIALGKNVTVTYRYVDSLPQSPTGKHRYVRSELS